MTEQETPTTTTESEADTEFKPIKPNEPPKTPQNKQTKLRPRHLPPPPGFVPVPMDIVITMTIQFLITFTCILVMFVSAAIDNDDIAYYIIAEVVFTFIGFGYFTRKIQHNFLVYYKFYRKVDECTHRRYQKLKNSDSSCANVQMLLIFIFYCIYQILIFPVVILWSMYQSYKWYQDRHKKRHTQESQRDLTERQSERVTKRAYNILHLGLLVKQASIISIFLQDLPFLIICGIIGNNLGLAVFPIVICLKLLFWFKHCFDLGKATFYNVDDFLIHFGMLSIYTDPETREIDVEYMNERQFELATLQKGDWIRLYIGDDEYTQEMDTNDDHWMILLVYKLKNLNRAKNLSCITMDAVPLQSFEDYVDGKTKKLEVPEDCFLEFDRWDLQSHVIKLLNDEWFDRYYHDDDRVKDQEEKPEIDEAGSGLQSGDSIEEVADGTEDKVYTSEPVVFNGDVPSPSDSGPIKNVAGIKVIDSMNDGTEFMDVNDEHVNDNDKSKDVKIEIPEDKMENNEEEQVISTKADNNVTEVENEEIVNEEVENEEMENNNNDKEEVDNPDHEKQALTESQVVNVEEDVNEDHNEKAMNSGNNYESVPLNDEDENQDEQE